MTHSHVSYQIHSHVSYMNSSPFNCNAVRQRTVSHDTCEWNFPHDNMTCVICVLQCVAVCCSVLQCVAVCCSVLQCVAVCCSVYTHITSFRLLLLTQLFRQSLPNIFSFERFQSVVNECHAKRTTFKRFACLKLFSRRIHTCYSKCSWLFKMIIIQNKQHSYVSRDLFDSSWLKHVIPNDAKRLFQTDSFVGVTWYDVVRPAFTYGTRFICMRDMTQSYVRHDSVAYDMIWRRTYRICVRDMTHFYAWHDLFLCATWLMSMRDMLFRMMPNDCSKNYSKWTQFKHVLVN